MIRNLLITILLFGCALAHDYTVFYPKDMNLIKCDTRDKYQVGLMTMIITCEGIQREKVFYETEIEMLPAPYTIHYVKGGIQKGIVFDD